LREPDIKIPIEKPRRRMEGNIKMDLQVVGWVVMDWTDLAQERGRWRTLSSVVINLRIP
jgi:hypothetical protein